ncbi:MAG TPA: glycosyl hydrolase family 2, partial [Bryobacterales bacterium]|nr:glycosyl hydrolase family 2 [Bryobacterales bacterium]
MIRRRRDCEMKRFLHVLIAVICVPALVPARAAQAAGGRVMLDTGWALQSTAYVRETGETVSTSGFRPVGWYRAKVPSTVLAALVDAKVYDDPYFGTNLRLIPGAAYPPGEVFSNLPMSPDNPFRVAWWYRKEFRLPGEFRDKTVWLHFNGINYRANIWLNGRRIAGTDEVAGAYRIYEFDISEAVRRDGANVLAVEVFPPRVDDLAITFVDWNPT